MNRDSVLYGAAAGLLAIAAWNPAMPTSAAARSRAILLDRSASVTRAAGFDLAEALRHGTAGLASGDRICVIDFAGRARLAIEWARFRAGEVEALARALGAREAPDPLESDLAAAFALAAGALSGEAHPEAVLVSDGRATRGGAPGAFDPNFPWAGAAPPGRLAPNHAVVSLAFPRSAPPGATARIRAEVASEAGARPPATLRLTTRSPGRTAARDLPLRESERGSWIAEVEVAMPEDADLELEARIDGRDPFPEDDAARGAIRRRGIPRVAIRGAAPSFLAALRSIPTIEVVELAGDPKIPADVDVVVTVDQGLDELGAAALPLEEWVRAGGAWFAMGARRTFAEGAFAGSPLESALPLAPDSGGRPREEILILLDASGSMAGAKLEAAKDAARRLARRAPAGASVRGASFQTQLSEPFDLRAPDASARLEAIVARGPTEETAALRAAVGRFSSPSASSTRRRVFLVSDGLEKGGKAPLADAKNTGEALAAAQIECVAFAVGADADHEFLSALTLDGKNGRALRVEELASLPEAVGAEAERGALAPGGPVACHRPSGAPFAVTTLPPVAALARTKARDGALVLASVEGGLPLLAWNPATRTAALAVAPGSELAPAYAPLPELWRNALAALATQGDLPAARIEGSDVVVEDAGAGDAGSADLSQGARAATLWRTGPHELRGALGALVEGWAALRTGGGVTRPVYLEVPAPREGSPQLRARAFAPTSALPTPLGAPSRPLACVLGVALLLLGAASGWARPRAR